MKTTKFAVLGPRGGIFRVRDSAPPAGIRSVGVTDDQAASIAAIQAAHELPVWLNGAVVSRKAVRQAGDRLRWDEAKKTLVREKRPEGGGRWACFSFSQSET